MKVTILSLIFLLLGYFSELKSQTYIDVRMLPRPDCNGGALYPKFDSCKNKILVLPNSVDDSVEFNRILSYMKTGWEKKAIKYESELCDSDYTKALEIYGPIQGFKYWEKFNVPIEKIKGGFIFKGKQYSGVADGLTYLSPNRYVFTGNSSAIIWNLQSTVTSYYEYFVFKNGLLSLVGIPGKTDIDLDEIRQTNYTMVPSKFFNLYISKEISGSFPPDSIVYAICNTMHLPLPGSKIQAYMHSDPNAARLFSNFFFMTGCDILPDSVKFGTCQFGSIHAVGLDYWLLRHESFHILWENLVGNSNLNPFFSEGIETYYEFLSDTLNYSRALAVARKHTDFDITNLLLKDNGQDFWRAPTENGWPITYNVSGLFVKFLVDKWGLENFKRIYLIDNKELALKEIYGATLTEVIDGFRQSIE